MGKYMTLLIVVEPLHLPGSQVGQAAGSTRSLPWTHYVRIGGASTRPGEIQQSVKEAEETHVFGIKIDNDIEGRYDSFRESNPTDKLDAIKQVADQAHATGNYAFVYIAGFESASIWSSVSAIALYSLSPLFQCLD